MTQGPPGEYELKKIPTSPKFFRCGDFRKAKEEIWETSSVWRRTVKPRGSGINGQPTSVLTAPLPLRWQTRMVEACTPTCFICLLLSQILPMQSLHGGSSTQNWHAGWRSLHSCSGVLTTGKSCFREWLLILVSDSPVFLGENFLFPQIG